MLSCLTLKYDLDVVGSVPEIWSIHNSTKLMK